MTSRNSGSKHSALDTDVIPLGERALRSILNHVNVVGDEAETTYLEVKGLLDLSTKSATAKVAKFLLGAANRRPHEAARHFHGYAVLVIGAQKDSMSGIPRGSEAHELEDRLRPYLGPQFPAFEFGRIGVDAENEVLFIIAQPPQAGQTIFPCHKSFQGEDRRDNLEDGAIYVRGTSNTRPARSGEVLALVERSRSGGPRPIKLEVEVLGPICRVDHVEEVLESLRDYEERQFSKRQGPMANDFAPESIRQASSLFGTLGSLPAEDRKEALNAWRSARPQHLTKAREHLLGVGLSGAGIRVISHDRFVAKPHLIVTFHGCELIDHLNPDDADLKKVVEPVVRRQHPFSSFIDYSVPRPRGYPVVWNNRGEHAEVVLSPESFRPNVPWTSDQDDYVLVARDPHADWVEVTWVLTEDGIDTDTTGGLRVPTAGLIGAADLFKAAFAEGD